MAIIDAHVNIGESLFGQDQPVDDLLRLMDDCSVDKAVLCPNRPKNYHLWPANEFVAQVVADHPDRFLGICRVDPWQGSAALVDLKRAREEMNLRGLLLHPWEEQFQVTNALVTPLIEYAAEQKMPILVETGYPLVSHPLDVAEIAARHPKAVFIGTHGLQLDSSAFALVDAERAMFECDNLIMETSGMYAPEVMEKIVQELGAHRLIFGSHTPWYNMRLEVERVKLLKLESEQIEAVLGGNIVRLLDPSWRGDGDQHG